MHFKVLRLWPEGSPGPGLLIHSDQGLQYCSDGFREEIERHQFIQRMNRKGIVVLLQHRKITIGTTPLPSLSSERSRRSGRIIAIWSIWRTQGANYLNTSSGSLLIRGCMHHSISDTSRLWAAKNRPILCPFLPYTLIMSNMNRWNSEPSTTTSPWRLKSSVGAQISVWSPGSSQTLLLFNMTVSHQG